MRSFLLLILMFSIAWFPSKTSYSLAQGQFKGRGCPERETDLSGIYRGSLSLGEDKAFNDAILTIEKDRFSVKTAEGEFAGMFSANTTCDYTAVALRFGDVSSMDWAMSKGTTLSLRATVGPHAFKLRNVSGEPFDFSFQCDCKKCNDPKACDCCAGKTP